MHLALTEMRRAKARFALLIGAVALLVFLIIFQQTLSATLLGFFTGGLKNQTGEVIVFGADARRNVEGSLVFPEQVSAIANVEGVAVASPIGENTFTVTASGKATDAVIFGYTPAGPGEPTTLSAGRLPERDREAVASSVDADEGFGIGDTVEVLPSGMEIEIVGLAEDARFAVLPTMFTTYATWEEATASQNPDAAGVLPTLVGITLDEGVSPQELATRLNSEVSEIEALDRETAAESLPGVSSIKSSFNIILALAFIVVVLVTGFFFLILTVQKTQALTLLRAVGASTSLLVRTLALQVFLVTLSGLAAATALLAFASVSSSASFPIEVDPQLVLTTGTSVLVLALLASFAAVRRVTRIDPATAASKGSGTGGLI